MTDIAMQCLAADVNGPDGQVRWSHSSAMAQLVERVRICVTLAAVEKP